MRKDHPLLRYLRKVRDEELEHTDPDADGFSQEELGQIRTDMDLLIGQMEMMDIDLMLGKE